jgi:adenine-specific DNA glycosylase
VLPVDTNVRRVLDRTGEQFGPAAAHALMDLGATICLARIPRCATCPLAERCPSRGKTYAPLRKQSRFEGSFRQRRAATLRLVSDAPRQVSQLDGEALEALRKDGFLAIQGDRVKLAEFSPS